MADRPQDNADGSLRDWYLEEGRVVFTEAYHLKRGYCCGNRCRHCPYDGEARAAATRDRQAG